MPDQVITPILLNVALSLAKRLASIAWSALSDETPVRIAITETVDAVPDLQGLDKTLSDWCNSEEFGRQVEDFNSGNRELVDSDVIAAFLKSTQFYAGEQTQERAGEVLSIFLANLEQELYKSEEGPSIFAQRFEQVEAGATEDRRDIREGIASIQQQLGQWCSAAPDDVDRRIEDQTLHTRLDETKTLLIEGKPLTARQRLLALRAEVATKTVSPEVLFRIAANLGAAALQLNELNKAIDEFETALRHQPHSQKGLGNCAQVALLSGDNTKGLELAEKAFEIDRHDAYSASLYLRALYLSRKNEKLNQVLEKNPWMDADPEVLLGRAWIAYEQERFEDSESFLRKSLEDEKRNAHAWNLCGCSISVPIQRRYEGGRVVPWLITETETERLAEAEQAFSGGIDDTKSASAESCCNAVDA